MGQESVVNQHAARQTKRPGPIIKLADERQVLPGGPAGESNVNVCSANRFKTHSVRKSLEKMVLLFGKKWKEIETKILSVNTS